MPRIVRLIAVFAVIVAMASAASAAPSHRNDQTSGTPSGQRRTCTVEAFDIWAGKVWDQAHWRRGAPPQSTIDAQRRWLACAPNAKARQHMQQFWREVKADYYSARRVRLRHKRVDPFYGCTVGGCGHWPIPTWSVNCESGGGAASGNLYGNTQTYVAGMSKWQQDVAAHQLLADAGGGPSAYAAVWLAWESGCAGYPGPGWTL